MRRKEYLKRKRVQTTISGVAELFEKEAYLKSERFWEEFKKEGKIIYYPPGELPII